MGPRSPAVTAALLLAALSAGCTALVRETAPSGLPRGEDELRRSLAAGEVESALAAVAPGGEVESGDALLALMFRGLVAHYAGRWSESSEAIGRAEALAEDRYTRSVSRALASLVVGDRVLAYDPEPTERLLLHYYDALNYLRAGDRPEAAVAARRLSHLLDVYSESPASGRELRVRAFLRLFAGAVFESAGEANDAAVAYRLAEAAGAALPPPEDGMAADSPAPSSPRGDVLVVVEKGFIAHRAEESFHVLLWPHEIDAFHGGEPERRIAASTCLADRLLGGAEVGSRPEPPAAASDARLAAVGPLDPATRERCVLLPAPLPASSAPPAEGPRGREARAADPTVPRLIRMAWPVIRREGEVHAAVRVLAGEETAAPLALQADLSDAVIAEFESGAARRLATTLARAALKYAAARALEQEAGDEDDTLGDVVGVLADAGAALLERADLRAWHLLPDEMGVVRLRLPPGRHRLLLALGDPGSERRLEAGEVDVRAGGLEVVSARVWSARASVGALVGER